MRHRSERLISEINIGSFLAVMLTILFIVLADSNRPGDASRRPSVNHPRAAHVISVRGADNEDAVVISINRYGWVFLRNYGVSIDNLPVNLRDALNRSEEKRVYVDADARAKYGSVLRVMEVLQAEKIARVVFLVDERKTPSVIPGAVSTQ